MTVVLTIGTTTAILSLGDAVLLRPLPFPESDRLVAIDTLQFPPGLHQLISTNLAAANNLGTSYPNFFDWQQQNKVQCFRRSDDVWPHCCCSVAAMNFLAHVDAVIFRSARKWRGRPEDGRDDLKLSLRQTDSSQRLTQSKRGLHDSGLRTLPYVPGTLADKPAFVLTSKSTFSRTSNAPRLSAKQPGAVPTP